MIHTDTSVTRGGVGVGVTTHAEMYLVAVVSRHQGLRNVLHPAQLVMRSGIGGVALRLPFDVTEMML